MAERRIVEGADLPKHRNPIPTCVVLGDLILPSVIAGGDPKGGGIIKDPEKQVEQAFVNMQNIVEAAGGSLNTIGKVVVYLKDPGHRPLVNQQWVRVFPKENRPARHIIHDTELPGDMVIQMDVIAMLERS